MADENEAEESKAEETQATEGEDGEEGKKKGGKMLFILGGVGGLLVILIAAAAFLLLGGGGDEEHADAEHGEEHAAVSGEHGDGHSDDHGDGHGGKGDDHGDGHGDGHGDDHGAHAPASEVVFYELPDLLVNLRAEGGRSAYLKLKVTLEVDSEDTVHAIEPAMPRVMDRYLSFLRELRVEDLAGSAGSYRLRLELLRRVNLAVAPAHVRAVLIEEMLIQ